MQLLQRRRSCSEKKQENGYLRKQSHYAPHYGQSSDLEGVGVGGVTVKLGPLWKFNPW